MWSPKNFKRNCLFLSILCFFFVITTLAYSASLIVKDRRTLTSFSFHTGQVTCASAGTKYSIPDEAEALSIKALSTNTGLIYVGNSTTATSSAGYELKASESIDLGGQGFYIAGGTVQITCSQNGDKVSWARLY